jgi:hypothetical protein
LINEKLVNDSNKDYRYLNAKNKFLKCNGNQNRWFLVDFAEVAQVTKISCGQTEGMEK